METEQNKSYWNAAGMAGVIFGLLVFIVSLIGSYITIYSEPDGSLVTGNMVASAIGCLIGAFEAVLAVKRYINEYGPEITIGKGAIIGLATGVMITLVFQLLSLIWPLIDTSYIENLHTAMINNIEMMEQIPAAQKEEMIDSIYTQMQNYYSAGTILQNLFLGLLIYGLLNLLSGLLSAKFMGTSLDELE